MSKKVKRRNTGNHFLKYDIESLEPTTVLLILYTDKALFQEFRRQEKLLLKKQESKAIENYTDLFRQVNLHEFYFELQLVISNFRLLTKDKHTYKRLHREILILLKKHRRINYKQLLSYQDNYCNIKLKNLLKINKSELQIKILHFLYKIEEGQTFKDLGYYFNQKTLNDLSLKKLTSFLAQK